GKYGQNWTGEPVMLTVEEIVSMRPCSRNGCSIFCPVKMTRGAATNNMLVVVCSHAGLIIRRARVPSKTPITRPTASNGNAIKAHNGPSLPEASKVSREITSANRAAAFTVLGYFVAQAMQNPDTTGTS